jgi:glycosyltransferase involved in cell wall biosynthesis
MTSVAIVVVTHNAGPEFAANLVQFADYFAPYRDAYHFAYIIVDDASTDQTLQFCESFARYRRDVTVIIHERRCGLGKALRAAFLRVRAEYTIVVDDGMTYAAAAAMELLEALENTGADVAIASPYMRGAHVVKRPMFREMMERFANRVLSLIARGRCASFTCALRAYRTQFLKRLSFSSDGAHAIPELLFAAIREGGHIIERPTRREWEFGAFRAAFFAPTPAGVSEEG